MRLFLIGKLPSIERFWDPDSSSCGSASSLGNSQCCAINHFHPTQVEGQLVCRTLPGSGTNHGHSCCTAWARSHSCPVAMEAGRAVSCISPGREGASATVAFTALGHLLTDGKWRWDGNMADMLPRAFHSWFSNFLVKGILGLPTGRVF